MYDYRKFLQEFEEFRVRARHLFEERISAVSGDSPTSSGEWTPSVDIYETEDRIVLVAEVAGVRLEDVHLQVLDNVITLRGHRASGRHRDDGDTYLRMEFAGGAFERSFALPYPIVDKGVQATLRDGVLTVTLPRGGAPPLRVEVGPG